MDLTGNTILITGGTSGIGLAFAEEFLRRGNTVIICGRRQDRLDALQQKHPGLMTKKCDVSIIAEREELYKWIITNHPGTNVLMNNAGVQLATDMTKPVDLERVHAEVETNFVAPLHLASLFAQHLGTHQEAAIINISSGLSFVPIAFMPVYCATKAAMHSLTLSLRHQMRNTTVKVIEIAPPSTDTELGHDMRPDKTQSHGGIPISEFMAEAMEGLENGTLEIAVGMSKGLRAMREEMFAKMNSF